VEVVVAVLLIVDPSLILIEFALVFDLAAYLIEDSSSSCHDPLNSAALATITERIINHGQKRLGHTSSPVGRHFHMHDVIEFSKLQHCQ